MGDDLLTAVTLDPAPDGDMVDRKTALGHDLLEIAIGERVSQVPTNAQEDDRILEMTPAKQCWPFSDHGYTVPNPLSAFATQPLQASVYGLAWVPDRRLVTGWGGERVYGSLRQDPAGLAEGTRGNRHRRSGPDTCAIELPVCRAAADYRPRAFGQRSAPRNRYLPPRIPSVFELVGPDANTNCRRSALEYGSQTGPPGEHHSGPR